MNDQVLFFHVKSRECDDIVRVLVRGALDVQLRLMREHPARCPDCSGVHRFTHVDVIDESGRIILP